MLNGQETFYIEELNCLTEGDACLWYIRLTILLIVVQCNTQGLLLTSPESLNTLRQFKISMPPLCSSMAACPPSKPKHIYLNGFPL